MQKVRQFRAIAVYSLSFCSVAATAFWTFEPARAQLGLTQPKPQPSSQQQQPITQQRQPLTQQQQQQQQQQQIMQSQSIQSRGVQMRNGKPVFTSKKVNIPGVRMGNQIPTNFPVATYPSNVTNTFFAHSTAGSPSAALTINTRDEPRAAFDWYKSYLAREKWAVKSPSEKLMEKYPNHGRVFFLEATRDKNQVNLVCTPQTKEAGAAINIVWSPRKAL